MPRFSEPSVSARADDMLNEIAVSSLPEAAATLNAGVSATGSTVTLRVWTLSAVDVASEAVAVTVRVKLLSSLLGGVMVNPDNWSDVNVQLPSPLSVPADRVAPVGMWLIGPDGVRLVQACRGSGLHRRGLDGLAIHGAALFIPIGGGLFAVIANCLCLDCRLTAGERALHGFTSADHGLPG